MEKLHVKKKTKNSFANISGERRTRNAIPWCVTIFTIVLPIKRTVLPIDWDGTVSNVPMLVNSSKFWRKFG